LEVSAPGAEGYGVDEYILKIRRYPPVTAVAGSYSKLVIEDPKNMYRINTT
jgi:hypothetical protein